MARQAKQRGNNPAATTPATTPAKTQEDPKPVEGEEKQDATATPEADGNNPAATTPATTPAEPSAATPPDENDGSDDEPPEDVAGECILILKQKAALGNGTRARGEAICTISRGEDGHLDLESAEPVKGVIAAEVRTAINNLHLLDVAPITPPTDDTE